MSGSIPLRDPAWADAALEGAQASFEAALDPGTREWLETSALRDLLGPDVTVSGALRPPRGGGSHAGHYLVLAHGLQHIAHVKCAGAALDVTEAAQITDQLAAAGLAVARYLRSPTTGSVEVTVDTRAVTVTDYVPARHAKTTSEDAEALGTLLGQVHRALREIPPTDTLLARNAEMRTDLRNAAETLRTNDGAGVPEAHRSIVREAALRFDPNYSFAGSPQRVHGDVTPGNVLYEADGSARLCDFENAGFAWWPTVFDLSSAVLRFCLAPPGSSDQPAACATGRARADRLRRSYAAAAGEDPPWELVLRTMRNLVDHNLVVRWLIEHRGGPTSPGEWRKLTRLAALVPDLE